MTSPEGNGLPGVAQACAALADGRAVVVPNPSPMTYGIVATDPRAVNALKLRPLEQQVAVSVHNRLEWQPVEACLDLPDDMRSRLVDLLRQRLSLLLPLRDDAVYPDWVGPAVRDGYVAVFDGYWAPTAALWGRFPRLYGSSANRTGAPPAGTAAQARTIFAADAPVVDGDMVRELDAPHAASTMVKVARDATLILHRHGAQDLTAGLEPDVFLQRLI